MAYKTMDDLYWESIDKHQRQVIRKQQTQLLQEQQAQQQKKQSLGGMVAGNYTMDELRRQRDLRDNQRNFAHQKVVEQQTTRRSNREEFEAEYFRREAENQLGRLNRSLVEKERIAKLKAQRRAEFWAKAKAEMIADVDVVKNISGTVGKKVLTWLTT